MTEYNYFPLWDLETGENLDEEDLPLSVEMIEKLNNWADIYNNIINWDNPSESGFKSSQEQQDFDNQGVILAMELQKELGKDYQVFLFRENLEHLLIEGLDSGEFISVTDEWLNQRKKELINSISKTK